MTPFDRIGGTDGARSLTEEFYGRIETDARFSELRSLHGNLDGVRQAFALWLGAWLGGPPIPADPRGCIMSRHRAMAFGASPAAQWVEAMDMALERHVADHELRSAMRSAFVRMASAMVRAVRPGEAAED